MTTENANHHINNLFERSEIVIKCSLRLETAIQQIEKQEVLHDRSKDNSGF